MAGSTRACVEKPRCGTCLSGRCCFVVRMYPSEKEKSMTTGTVRLHRVLRCPPERVYRAFLEAEATAKWLPPYGFTARVEHMDARVGGRFRMAFTNFGTGHSHSFGGEYLELVQDERIR